MSNAVSVLDQVRSSLTAMEPQFAAALPAHVNPKKFTRVVMTTLQLNPQLLECDRKSLYASCMRCAADGLVPDGREAAIVAFGNQAQYMPMVAGLMRRVFQSKEIAAWSQHVVHEKDQFEYQLGDDEKIVHKPTMDDDPGRMIAVYSIVVLTSGYKTREVMTMREIEAIRKRSRSATKGPWVTDFEQMALKTVIRRHAKRLPMSTDLDDFLRQDDLDDPALVQRVPEAPAYVELAAEPAPKGRRPKALEKAAQAANGSEAPPTFEDMPNFSESSQEPHGDPLGD